MKKVLAVFLATILILQTGMTIIHAEGTEENRRVIVIGHVDSLPLDDGTVPYATIIATYGFSAANIEIINERWIRPYQFRIYGKDIPIDNGKYSYQLKLRSDGTLLFDNDLEIYYQGIDGLYRLDYEIDKTDNHTMLASGVFDNIIVASPILDNLPERISDWVVTNVSDDTYNYELDLWTDYGFTFENKLQFLFDSTELSLSTKYDYDLPTDVSTVMICWTKGDDRFVIGPIEFKPLSDTSQNIIKTISDNVKGLKELNIEDLSANIRQILKDNEDVLPQIKEKTESLLTPAVNDALNRIGETLSDPKFSLPDFNFSSQIGNDIKNRVEDIIGRWN